MSTIVEYVAIGRRKESVARVRLRPGSGKLKVNKRAFEDYFPRETHRIVVLQPLKVANALSKYDVMATIRGGGLSGQAGALKHGISRALLKTEDTLRFALKSAGFLTRDPRAKERKKYGQKRPVKGSSSQNVNLYIKAADRQKGQSQIWPFCFILRGRKPAHFRAQIAGGYA